MTLENIELLVPSAFYLGQNSPNPFTKMTKIKYCLPKKVKVNLTLINTKNKRVRELVNGIQEAGTYEIKIDGNDFPHGFNNYQLKAFDLEEGASLIFIKTKKMLLIK